MDDLEKMYRYSLDILLTSLQRLTYTFVQRVKNIYGAVLQLFPTDGEQEMRQIFEVYGGPEGWRASDRGFVSAFGLENRLSLSQSPETAGNSIITRAKHQALDQSVSEPERRLRELKVEIKSSVDQVIQDNLRLFRGVMKIELDRIETNLTAVVRREDDRTIEALSEGPWESIFNQVSPCHGIHR